MFPIAHIASAVAFNRYVFNDGRLTPSILGALIPDAVDKTLAWVLRITSSSHHIAHTPLAALMLSFVVKQFANAEVGRSFGAAYFLHLLGDEIHHGRVPWLLPFRDYRRRPSDNSIRPKIVGLVFEVAGIAYMAAVLRSEMEQQCQTGPL